MELRNKISATVLVLTLVLGPSSLARAQNAGEAKLNDATAAKLNASSPADFEKVIELCEEALAEGLDDGGTRIAKQLLAAAALQRAQIMVQGLPAAANNPNALRQLRRKTMDSLNKAVEANPELTEAFLLMAKLETLPGGNRTQAMEYLTKSIDLLKDKPVDRSAVYIMRAQLQEDNESRIQDLRKAIEADSTNTDAWQALVVMQLALGKFQETVDDAKKMLERDDSNDIALQAAIDALLGLKKEDEAIELLNGRIEKDDTNGAYYRVRALALRQKSYNEDLSEEQRDAINKRAMDDLNKAIELNNRDSVALVLRGTLYYEQDEIEKANRDVSDSLLIEPNSAQGVLLRSLVAAREGRFADAVADMEVLVRVNPNEEWVRQLANYYLMDKRPRLAIKLLDQLLAEDKENWRAMRLRGDAKLSVGLHREAVEDYESAVAILEKKRAVKKDEESSDFDYSGLLNNLAWVLATSPKDELRDGKRSVELGLKACEATDYKAAHILSTLAAGYAEVGDFENARKWSAKAVELGKEEENEQVEQLEKELESYEMDKPWREAQETEENNQPRVKASETIET